MESVGDPASSGVQARLRAFIEHPRVQGGILALILINAVLLGLETWPAAMAVAGGPILALDRAILTVFVVEIALRLYAHRLRFLKDPWSVFDFAVVAIALLPQTGAFAVLRVLRVLRLLRLVSMVPSMRGVVGALLASLPGLGSIAALLGLVLYVGAVMATKLFGALSPQFFGDLGKSLFTLFQVMTIEGWPDIARPLMVQAPWAWAFFVVFILVSTFTVLNLFIAVVVNAMQRQVAADLKHEEDMHAAEARLERAALLAELRALREEIREMKALLAREEPAKPLPPRWSGP